MWWRWDQCGQLTERGREAGGKGAMQNKAEPKRQMKRCRSCEGNGDRYIKILVCNWCSLVQHHRFPACCANNTNLNLREFLADGKLHKEAGGRWNAEYALSMCWDRIPLSLNVWSWKSMGKIEGGGREVDGGRRNKNSCCDQISGWTFGNCCVSGRKSWHTTDAVNKQCMLTRKCSTWHAIDMQMLHLSLERCLHFLKWFRNPTQSTCRKILKLQCINSWLSPDKKKQPKKNQTFQHTGICRAISFEFNKHQIKSKTVQSALFSTEMLRLCSMWELNLLLF